MRLALIGVGLIGASAAWAMKRGGVFDTVSAFDLSTKSVLKAVDMGIADAASSTLQECVQGADAVLVNTAIAVAGNPVEMAIAFKDAVIAGRRAYEAGLGAQCTHAIASSPLTSFLD